VRRDGWRLRATPAVDARRSNSVLPNGDSGEVPLKEKLAIVEDFFGRRGLPVRYQLSPAAEPAGLVDDVLAARGFQIETSADIQVANLAEVVDRSLVPGTHVVSADRPGRTLALDPPGSDSARRRRDLPRDHPRPGPPACPIRRRAAP
jgi:hypothetical protein